MSSSYDRNIERMRSRERANTQQSINQTMEMANTMGNRGIQEAQQFNKQLSAFSKHFKRFRKKREERANKRGAMMAQEQATINAERLVELQNEISTLTAEDTRFHEIKAEMLKLSGPDVYPDADRLTKMSRYEQAGYLKEKLRSVNDTFAEKLSHSMMTSEKALRIENVTFTAKRTTR